VTQKGKLTSIQLELRLSRTKQIFRKRSTHSQPASLIQNTAKAWNCCSNINGAYVKCCELSVARGLSKALHLPIPSANIHTSAIAKFLSFLLSCQPRYRDKFELAVLEKVMMKHAVLLHEGFVKRESDQENQANGERSRNMSITPGIWKDVNLRGL
jgi:hypothetical protein